MRLALLLIASSQVVLVPTGGSPEQCVARTRLAAAVALSPELRVLRASLKNGEALEDARRRTRAQWALDGQTVTARSKVQWIGDAIKNSGQGRGVSATAEALSQAWPKNLERPQPAGFVGAANAEALTAACAGDADAAYGAAGAAVPALMSQLVTPPKALKRGTVMQRWAWARNQLDTAGCRNALGVFRGVTQSLEKGHLPPIWRRPPRDQRRPSSITRVDGAWVLFEEGRFFAIDPHSGHPLWQRETSKAEPAPIALGEGYLALVTAKGVQVVETKTGTTAWRTQFRDPASEIAVTQGLMVTANRQQIVAYERATGAIRWQHDGLSRPAAGPVAIGGLIVAPLSTRLVVLNANDGALVHEIELDDEITAPLLVGDGGKVWVSVGADQLALVDPRRGKVTYTAKDVFGISWPPAVLAGRLVAALETPKGPRHLAFIRPGQARPPRKYVRGLLPPVIGLSDYSGFVHAQQRPWTVVAKDQNGGIRWQARQPRAIRALSAPGDLVVAGVGKKVIVLDRKRGRALWHSDFESPVLDVHFDQDGGVVALENGALYGLPGARDPRLPAQLEAARLDLGACQLKLRQYSAAEATAIKVLGRAPKNLDAQVLIARVRQARRRPEAVATWLKVLALASPADPAHAEARAALNSIAGIKGRAVPALPLVGLVNVTKDQVLAKTNKGEVRINLETGALAHLAEPSNESLELVRGKTDALVHEGQRPWRLSLDNTHFALSAQTAAHIVLSSTTAEGRMLVVDAQTGTRRWERPLESRVFAAWPSADAILARTQSGLLGLDAKTGQRRFKLAAGKGVKIFAHAAGWLLLDGARLVNVDARGRRRFAMLVPGIINLRIAPELAVAFMWTGGEFRAIDLKRGQQRGRLSQIHVQDVVLTDEFGAIVTTDGALLSFDPKRLLQP